MNENSRKNPIHFWTTRLNTLVQNTRILKECLENTEIMRNSFFSKNGFIILC